MLLIVFDQINSRSASKSIEELSDIESERRHIMQLFNIDNRDIDINHKYQFRIIRHDSANLFDIIYHLFQYFNNHQVKTRCCISLGQVDNPQYRMINQISGEALIKNQKLLNLVKADKQYYAIKEHNVRYIGYSDSSQIDQLCCELSQKVIADPSKISIYFEYIIQIEQMIEQELINN